MNRSRIAVLVLLPICAALLVGCPFQSAPDNTGDTGGADNTPPGTPLPDAALLDIEIEGEGSVLQTVAGTLLTLNAVPAAGWQFVTWFGSASSTTTPLTITPTDTTVIGARFVSDPNQTDSDGDLVVDALDSCPDTPVGASVNTDGCGDSQIDTDGDGIMDDVDLCNSTAVGAIVGDDGCTPDQRDTDSDGVTDNNDSCPGTPSTEAADDTGCSASQRDEDNDGVSDADDTCPDTPANAPVDSEGCPLCGNEVVDGGVGEDCEPPGSATCDNRCKFIRPSNDDCEASLTASNGDTPFTNLLALPATADDTDCGGVPTDLWYCYAAACNGTATIGLCDSDFDTVTAVYSGCSCPADSIIACGEDECAGDGGQSEVTISVRSGQSFLIRVGGFNGTTGEGKLNITCNAGACLTNADCDNGAFCDGDESCINNICVGGSSPCPLDETCNEGLNRCDECQAANDCDDGNLCTTDSCTGGRCQHEAVVCNDDDPCTDDFCDTTTGACEVEPHCADDGVFCNGVESCESDGTCVSPGDPCELDERCEEAEARCILTCIKASECDDANPCTIDSCQSNDCVNQAVDCPDGLSCQISFGGACGVCGSDADCDNGLFCDGQEECQLDSNETVCVDQDDPCMPEPEEFCNETQNRCDECANDDDCDDSEDCTTDTCSGSGFCEFVTDETDSDDDGTPDCADGCPTDPNKTEEGLCGCGVSDVNSDGDSEPDCTDECDNDPNKILEGLCGCGIADTDSDDDGTPDCDDECPDDRFKTLPGICGCGEFDRDLDADLTMDCIDNCLGLPNESQEDGDNDGVGTACDDCPDVGGLQIDDGGCPLASTWISDRILLGIRRSGYIQPERYELDLTATLVTATLGLSETTLAPLGTVLSLNPDVPLDVSTEVFALEDLFGTRITDTVDIQLFQLNVMRAGAITVEWRFIVTVTHQEGSSTARKTFDGTQTGTMTPDGTTIFWQSVTGFTQTCNLPADAPEDCNLRVNLVPGFNWPSGGRWTLSE